MALFRRVSQTVGGGRQSLDEHLPQRGRHVRARSELERRTARHQHACEGTSERLVGRSGQRVERVGQRKRLTEAGRDLDERALLRDAQLVLAQQLRDTKREADLPRDSLGQRDLFLRPGPSRRLVEAEHADQLVEDDERHGESCARAELEQRGATPDSGVELGAFSTSSITIVRLVWRARFDTPSSPDALDRGERSDMPLSAGDVGLRPEPDEAALNAELAARLLDGDPKHLVDVQLRPDARRDACDESLTLQRLREIERRTRAVERSRALTRELLQRIQLIRRESPPLRRGARDENGDHALRDDERNEGETLRADRLDEPLAHDLRRRRVVD